MTTTGKTRQGGALALTAGRLVAAAATALAVAGGLVLTSVMLVTCASVIGRAFFNSPILGDFELVEAGCAIAVFAFLPYCQLKGGHITVDIVSDALGSRKRRVLAMLNEAVFAAVAGLLAWRAMLGGIDLWRYGETSMMLQIPIWWMFLVVVPALALLCVVCLLRLYLVKTGEHL